jgi:hypothetical protein
MYRMGEVKWQHDMDFCNYRAKVKRIPMRRQKKYFETGTGIKFV